MDVFRRRFTTNKVAPAGTDPQRTHTTFVKDEGDSPVDESVPSKFLAHSAPDRVSSGTKLVNFHDIVDQDERSVERLVSQGFAGWLVESLPFRMTILVLILVNSITIGVQTDRYLEENYGPLFLGLDKVFLTVFVMEVLVKWYHDFLGFWRVGWNVFDFVIVASSLLGPSLTFLSGSRILRILRVLRALRSLRSISALRGLQIVVHTILHSIPDMANIVALLFICMFIFGILGYSFFADDCPRYFGTLGTAMFSLFICVTQDGWMGIMRDLQQCGNHILGAVYLLIFITVGAFIFANLVVAVVVTNLEWAIAEQKEMEKKQVLGQHSEHVELERTIRTVDASETLEMLAKYQEPMEVPDFSLRTRVLEKYFLLVSAMEDNLAEFKVIQDQLTEISQEIRSLSSLDEVSDDEIFELREMVGAGSSSTLPHPTPQRLEVRPRRRYNSMAPGDALSDLINFDRNRTIDSSRAPNLHHLLHQLQSQPSSSSLTL